MGTRRVILNDFEINVDETETEERVREILADLRPEASNADLTVLEDGTFRFETVHGTKG